MITVVQLAGIIVIYPHPVAAHRGRSDRRLRANCGEWAGNYTYCMVPWDERSAEPRTLIVETFRGHPGRDPILLGWRSGECPDLFRHAPHSVGQKASEREEDLVIDIGLGFL